MAVVFRSQQRNHTAGSDVNYTFSRTLRDCIFIYWL